MDVNLREIAKRTKLSVATVSRAINRVPTVDPALSRRVWRVVEEIGYYPNTQARALVSGKSKTFGLVVSEITNPFFAELIQRFEAIAFEHGYEICAASIGKDTDRTDVALRRMFERRVDGVAVLTFGAEDAIVARLRKHKVPVVFVDGGNEGNEHGIQINYRNGIRHAIEHLAALRHTRIGFISGPLHVQSACSRRDTFEDCMRGISLSVLPELIAAGDHTIQGGMRALGGLLSLSAVPPTALICSNDLTAMGVICEAANRGLSVPGNLSVIGFDDITLAEFTIPPLTTVQMSQALLAEYAFHSLRNIVEIRPRKKYELMTNLVLRKSTSFPMSAGCVFPLGVERNVEHDTVWGMEAMKGQPA